MWSYNYACSRRRGPTVEQIFRKDQVVGSIPTVGSMLGRKLAFDLFLLPVWTANRCHLPAVGRVQSPRCPRPNGRYATRAKVLLEQIEVQDVDEHITVKICAVVIAWISNALAERCLDDVEVKNGHQVVVVRVARVHQAHLLIGDTTTHKRDGSRVSKKLRPFDAPIISAVSQPTNCHCEETRSVCVDSRIVRFRGARLQCERYR